MQAVRRETRLARCVCAVAMTTKIIGAVLLLSMSVGCHHAAQAGDVATAPPSSAPALGPSAGVSVQGAGAAEALLEAAEGLQLTESQREKVRGLKGQLARYEQNALAAFRALREDVAEQIRAGAIQVASVRADEDRAAGAMTVHVDKGAETMNALHAALEPSQRAALVAAVRAMQPGRAEAQNPRATRIARLASDLALDAAQERRVSAMLLEQQAAIPVFDEPPANVDGVLDGFTSGSFDGWTTVPLPLAPPAETFRQGLDRDIDFLARLVPVLRPAQRVRLASMIEAHKADP